MKKRVNLAARRRLINYALKKKNDEPIQKPAAIV
jgi:hypothetical protein